MSLPANFFIGIVLWSGSIPYTDNPVPLLLNVVVVKCRSEVGRFSVCLNASETSIRLQ